MAPPKEPLAYDVRFERGKLVLAAKRVNLLPIPRASGGFALDGRELLDLIRGRR